MGNRIYLANVGTECNTDVMHMNTCVQYLHDPEVQDPPLHYKNNIPQNCDC